jgi:hypothetical protein
MFGSNERIRDPIRIRDLILGQVEVKTEDRNSNYHQKQLADAKSKPSSKPPTSKPHAKPISTKPSPKSNH